MWEEEVRRNRGWRPRTQAVRFTQTSPGWLGYSEEKMGKFLEDTVAQEFMHSKLNVEGSREDDERR